MVQVASPPLLRIPKEMIKNDVDRVFWKNLNDWLYRLWKRSGGSQDFNENAENLLVSIDAKSQQNTALLDHLFTRDKIVITAVSITAKPFDTIICNNTASINVTLESNPIAGDVINIKRQNSEVIVIGTIDGQTDMVINVPYYSAKLAYTGSEWSRI